MKKILKLFIIIFTFFVIPLAINAEEKTEVNLYLFYGKECPHCEEEIKFLNSILNKEEYNHVKLHKYEVWHDKDNAKTLEYISSKLLKIKSNGVPYLVIGNNALSGYSEDTPEQILELISFYEKEAYKDKAGDYLGITHTGTNKDKTLKKSQYKNVPILGKINAKKTSLFLVSVVIGLVDGFNPCAMWILLFLLSLLISTKDRKRMWILGFTFILTSGLIYLAFMCSWLNIAKVTSSVKIIRDIIGIFAIAFGLVNIYRFIKGLIEKDVGCDVTDAKEKQKIMQKIRKILSENKLLLSILGIILLAVSVNIIELMCSLGLPVMFTEILSFNDLNTFEYILYMGIYIIFFLIDDLIVFFIAMKTLKLKGISNKYMKYSHLIGGLIMLIVGILMIINPALLMFNF